MSTETEHGYAVFQEQRDAASGVEALPRPRFLLPGCRFSGRRLAGHRAASKCEGRGLARFGSSARAACRTATTWTQASPATRLLAAGRRCEWSAADAEAFRATDDAGRADRRLHPRQPHRRRRGREEGLVRLSSHPRSQRRPAVPLRDLVLARRRASAAATAPTSV